MVGLVIGLYGGGNGCVAVFFVPIFKYDSLKFFQISIIWYICSIIETSMAKVIHVHLLHKIDGTKQKDWYFSSISAVYTVLTADQVERPRTTCFMPDCLVTAQYARKRL